MARKSAKTSAEPIDDAAVADDAGSPGLEDLRAQIDTLISRIESEDVPLEDAVASFEEAMLLTRRANRILADAEQRVTMLMEGEEPSADED